MTDPELEALRAKRLQELTRTHTVPSATKGEPVILTDSSFDSEVKKQGLILVDFWAAWCGPCLRVAPVLDQIAKERTASLRLGKLNVDDNPRTAERFQVSSIPTMLLFKDGRLVDATVGALPKAEIESFLDKWT
jgi:thioredoxin